MLCKKCPHHVRHGQIDPNKKGILFNDRCGLKMRANDQLDCVHYPFPKVFDYSTCEIYINTFKSSGQKNDAVPTQDFQYSDAVSASSITDMELL